MNGEAQGAGIQGIYASREPGKHKSLKVFITEVTFFTEWKLIYLLYQRSQLHQNNQTTIYQAKGRRKLSLKGTAPWELG